MNAATKLPGELGPIHFIGIGGIGMSGIANPDSLVDAAEYALKLLEGRRKKGL